MKFIRKFSSYISTGAIKLDIFQSYQRNLETRFPERYNSTRSAIGDIPLSSCYLEEAAYDSIRKIHFRNGQACHKEESGNEGGCCSRQGGQCNEERAQAKNRRQPFQRGEDKNPAVRSMAFSDQKTPVTTRLDPAVFPYMPAIF